MPQLPGSQIFDTPKGIDQMAGLIPSHGINGKIPPLKILLQGDCWAKKSLEAVIAPALLAFGACQGVILAALGMQKDWKIGPHLFETTRHHLLGCGAYHDPVPILNRHSQHFISQRATDLIAGQTRLRR